MDTFSKYLLGSFAVLGLALSSVFATASVANLAMQVQSAMIGSSVPTENNTAQLAAAGGVKGAPVSSPAASNASANNSNTTTATNSNASSNSPKASTAAADATTDTTIVPAAASSDTAKYVTGQILVKFKDGTSAANQDAALKANNASVKSTIAHIGVNIVKVPAGAEAKVAAALAHNPNVQFAETDVMLEPTLVPNDPYYANWEWHLRDIKAPAAWDITTGNPAGVTVAILDSGIDGTHPDLAPNLVPGYNFVANNTNTGADPSCPHGTTVAGAAGAVGNNGVGVTGVSWNSKIMPLIIAAASTSCSAPWSGMASAITYAADHGARVINISYGGTGSAYYSATTQSAVNYAWSKGAVVVASAGNGNTNTVTYPAALDNVVAVGATAALYINNTDLAGFSNYGSWVDVVAPGQGIYTTDIVGSAGFSTADYLAISGTSFSAPITAGVLGLMFAANPALTNTQAVTILEQTADDWGTPGFDTTYANGHINAARAVAAAAGITVTDTTAPIVTVLPYNRFGSHVQFSANASDNIGVKTVQIYRNGQLYATEPGLSYYNFPYDTSAEANGTIDSFYATATDYAGNTTTSPVVTIKVDNTPPVVSITLPVSGATISGTSTVTSSASDPETGVSFVDYSLDSTLLPHSTGSPNFALAWDTTKFANGIHTLKATAYNGVNNTASTTILVNIQNGTGTGTTDTTSPSTPTGVTGTAVSSTQINLSWSPSTDNVGVAGYRVFRSGIQAGAVTGTSFADTNLSASTAYVYTVAAYDAAGNVSAQSVGVTVTTQALADTTAPVTSISSPLAGATVNGTVGVSVSASDNVAVTKVELYVDGALSGTMTTSPYLFSWDTTTLANGSHTLQTKAYDAAGNVGTSAAIGVNVSNIVINDVTAPALTITSPKSGTKLKSSGNTSLAASASDPSGIASIVISFDGKVLKTCTLTASCSYSLSNKTIAAGTHTVSVVATDNSVNHNVASATVSVTK